MSVEIALRDAVFLVRLAHSKVGTAYIEKLLPHQDRACFKSGYKYGLANDPAFGGDQM